MQRSERRDIQTVSPASREMFFGTPLIGVVYVLANFSVQVVGGDQKRMKLEELPMTHSWTDEKGVLWVWDCVDSQSAVG